MAAMDHSWSEDGPQTRNRRKFALSVAVVAISTLLVAAAVANQFSRSDASELSEKSASILNGAAGPSQHKDFRLANRGRSSSIATVKDAEKLAADRRKAMHRASIDDLASDKRQLDEDIQSDKDQVSKAAEARKQMTMAVAAAESTLKQARDLAAKGRLLEGYSKQSRSASELDESEGVAIQQPAEELLKDSKKLNDQSNLVLDQSHSPQAKALAALDLKMAQSLAQRAGKGMASAKEYFARAIAARKRAVEEDVAAASDVRKAAKLSLEEQPGQPTLLHVVDGEVRGPQALAEIVSADVEDVEQKEEALGNAQGVLKEDQGVLLQAAERVEELATRSAALKKELAAAQKAVRDAEAAHQAAAAELDAATAQGLTAEKRASALESSEVRDAQKQLASIQAKKHKAEQMYRAALKKVADLNGHQTLLQVEVARLGLELKEAQMQRDEAERKEGTEQQTINSLQVQLDKEDEDLSRTRLQLADERIRLEPDASSAAASAPADHTAGDNGSLKDDSDSVDVSDAGSLSAGLDLERQREERLRQQQEAAEKAARDEELKLRRAQAAVAAQMAKVASLEKNIR